jgi:hypothetical protein
MKKEENNTIGERYKCMMYGKFEDTKEVIRSRKS